jgi:phage terminase large subunit GpA-like protein
MNSEELLQVGLEIIRPAKDDDPVEWLSKNVRKIPAGVFEGGYNPARWPWIGEAVRIFNEPTTSRMFMPWAIGCGKTLTLKLIATYLMANRRAGMAIYCDSQEKSKEFTLTQLRPMFEQVDKIKSQFSLDDNDKSGTLKFADGSLIYNRSANTEKHLQSVHVRYVLGSECWMWKNGAVAMSLSRLKAASFASKAAFESQPGDIEGQGAEFWKFYLMTDQRDWHFVCPNESCNHVQPWLWEYVRFPESAKTAGGWDFNAVEKGTTYECSKCRHRMEDTNEVRAYANEVSRGAGFISTTTAQKAGFVGLHVNALASTSWGSLAVDMIKAKEVAEAYGDEEPRRLFKTQFLALPWTQETGGMVVSTESSDYAMSDDWEAEAVITQDSPARVVNRQDGTGIPFISCAIDCQSDHFWVAIRRWAKTGHSRLHWFGRVDSNETLTDWTRLDELLARFKVNPHLVIVDSGDGNTTQEVYKQTALRGWKCSKGSGQEYFNVKDKAGNPMRRFYSAPQAIHVPGVKRPAELLVFSNLQAKDLFFGLRARRVFTFARDAGDDYSRQLDSEARIKDAGKAIWKLKHGEKHNHALDCELLNMLVAVRWGIIGRDAAEPTS